MTQRAPSLRELALLEHMSITPPEPPTQARTCAPFELDAALSLLRATYFERGQRWIVGTLTARLTERFKLHEVSAHEGAFWAWLITDPCLAAPIVLEADREALFERLRAITSIDQGVLAARYHAVSPLYELEGPLASALCASWSAPKALRFILQHVDLQRLSAPLAALAASVLDDDRAGVGAVAAEHLMTLPLEELTQGSYYAHSSIYALALLSQSQPLLKQLLGLLEATLHDDYYRLFSLMILALEDDALVLDALARVPAVFSPEQIGQLLMRLGFERLGELSTLVRRPHHHQLLKQLPPILEQLSSWRLVELLYDLSKHRTMSAWVDERLALATPPLVLGLARLSQRRGKRRDFALARLSAIYHSGAADKRRIFEVLEGEDAALIERVKLALVSLAGDDGEEALPAERWPEWMHALMVLEPDDAAVSALPLEGLPPLLMADGVHVVPAAIITRMLYACMLVHRSRKRSEEGAGKLPRAKKALEREAVAQLELLHEELDERAASVWVWALFMGWLEGGAEETQDWLMYMMAYLGDPIVALQLGAQLGKPRRLRGHQHSAYIKIGLNILSMMDTPVAWMMLSELKLKLKRSLKEHARQLIRQLLFTHKINLDTFEDFIVPALGFDLQGRRSFDYGGRSFELTIKHASTFELIDSEGAVFKRLPPRRAADDAAEVARSAQEYKLIIKQLKQAFITQRERFEAAMLERRQWSASRWRRLLYEHPVLRQLCCGLVWMSFEPEREASTRQLFLPMMDEELLGLDYVALELPKTHRVRVIHPMQLSQPERARWVELLTQLEIVQPIEQLSRVCYERVADHDRDIDAALKAQAKMMPSSLARWRAAGWRARHDGEDAWLTKYFSAYMMYVHVDFTGHHFERLRGLSPGVHYGVGRAQVLFFKHGHDEEVEGVVGHDEVDAQLYSELLRLIFLAAPVGEA